MIAISAKVCVNSQRTLIIKIEANYNTFHSQNETLLEEFLTINHWLKLKSS